MTAPGERDGGQLELLQLGRPAPLADLDITHYPSATGTNGYVTEVGLNTTGEALDWLAQGDR